MDCFHLPCIQCPCLPTATSTKFLPHTFSFGELYLCPNWPTLELKHQCSTSQERKKKGREKIYSYILLHTTVTRIAFIRLFFNKAITQTSLTQHCVQQIRPKPNFVISAYAQKDLEGTYLLEFSIKSVSVRLSPLTMLSKEKGTGFYVKNFLFQKCKERKEIPHFA